MDTTIEKDFGDWLSPILVKEIRQGFRSRVFVSSFLLIQGLMIFCVVWGGLITSNGDYGDSGSGFVFWMIVGIPLLLLMPAMGFGVLGSEIKGNTMELLFLTRLSTWRIVTGKWTAIVAQTLLIVCSVLPYMVLRYFTGGVNLLTDLAVLGWMLLGSALLTGITIAISPYYRSMLAKLFLPIATIVAIVFLISYFNSGAPASPTAMTSMFIIALVLGPLFLLLMFEIAVGRIAPPAENHAVRKRLIGYSILLALGLLNLFLTDTTMLMVVGAYLLLPICVTALCEDIKPIPSIYLPFVKRGALGKLGGLIFYPGWPSGFLFTIIAFVGYLVIFAGKKQLQEEDSVLLIVSMGGGLLMPLAVTQLFFSKFSKPFAVYVSLQIFMCIVMVLASALKDGILSDWVKLAAPLPTSVFFLTNAGRIDSVDLPFYILVQIGVLIASLVILLARSLGARREIAQYEQIARETLMDPEEEPQTAHADPA